MLKCPVCARHIKVQQGSFVCPWCKAKLRWPETSLLEWVVLGIVLMWAPFLIAFRLWPVEYAPWLGGLLALVLAIPISALWGFLRGTFFPSKVQRDSGWADDGTILHITPPPDPTKES